MGSGRGGKERKERVVGKGKGGKGELCGRVEGRGWGREGRERGSGEGGKEGVVEEGWGGWRREGEERESGGEGGWGRRGGRGRERKREVV